MEVFYYRVHSLRRAVKRTLPLAIIGAAVLLMFRAAERWVAQPSQGPGPVIGKAVRDASFAVGGFSFVWVLCMGLTLVSSRVLAQTTDPKNLQPTIERLVAAHKLPAAGGAMVTSAGVQSMGVVGVRKRGETVAATLDDLWHLGSNGKAMTAAMIARLVERGVMRWNLTLVDAFPELGKDIPVSMRDINVEHLLSHRAGLAANFDTRQYVTRRDLGRARLDVLVATLKQGTNSKPGEKILYSNLGYTIASAMAERVTGKPYETLMREEVFTPLKMTSAGFQGTGSPGKIDQPWPHAANGQPAPSNGPDMDNVPTMAAAGTIHMNLSDYGAFIAELLKATQGKSTWLTQATAQSLLQTRGDDYALGWLVPERKWAAGRAFHHGGDNTMNYSLVWGSANKDVAVIFLTNQSGSSRAGDELASAVITALQDKK
jgi:D-alanyl-D-alanine carboxypeptidase